ncbi:hypothetical protein V8F33_005824 [Rhypophila sp. PSN 637]
MTPLLDTIIDPEGDLWVSLAYRRYEAEPETRSSAAPPTSPEEPEAFNSLSQAKTEETTKVLVKVSSKVLIQASPVFKIMLTGWGKEAADFASVKAGGEIYTLDLPEDDAVAGILLFGCLHHPEHQFSADIPSTDDLEELAIMCDKYQCKLGPGGLDWIQNKFLHLTDPVRRGRIYPSPNKAELDQDIQGLSRLLVLSYVFEDRYMFSKLSWELFLCSDEPLGTENGPTDPVTEKQTLAIFSQRSGLRPFIGTSSLHRFLNKLNDPLWLGSYLNSFLNQAAEEIRVRREAFACLDCIKAEPEDGVQRSVRYWVSAMGLVLTSKVLITSLREKPVYICPHLIRNQDVRNNR